MGIVQHLRKEQYSESRWSGGVTTQLAIWPENAKYADRDFLWRISSATVDLEQSEFTDLPDYERLIATLVGGIEINHDGGARIALKPYQIHTFDGAAKTCSWGKCVDFNLMMRKGACSGRMEAVRAAAGEERILPISNGETLFAYLPEGTGSLRCADEEIELAEFDSALIRECGGEVVLRVQADSVFMIAVMQAKGKIPAE